MAPGGEMADQGIDQDSANVEASQDRHRDEEHHQGSRDGETFANSRDVPWKEGHVGVSTAVHSSTRLFFKDLSAPAMCRALCQELGIRQ